MKVHGENVIWPVHKQTLQALYYAEGRESRLWGSLLLTFCVDLCKCGEVKFCEVIIMKEN